MITPNFLFLGVVRRVFSTLVDQSVISCDQLADCLTGVLPKPLVSRIRLKFSYFTAHDWLELITTGAVYGLLETAPARTLQMMKKLREAIEILLRRLAFSYI